MAIALPSITLTFWVRRATMNLVGVVLVIQLAASYLISALDDNNHDAGMLWRLGIDAMCCLFLFGMMLLRRERSARCGDPIVVPYLVATFLLMSVIWNHEALSVRFQDVWISILGVRETVFAHVNNILGLGIYLAPLMFGGYGWLRKAVWRKTLRKGLRYLSKHTATT